MTIRCIEPCSVGAVAKRMSTIKPGWWDFEGASRRLQDVGLLAKLVGWYLEEDGAPKGWLLCAEFEGSSCLAIESLGYNENSAFVMEEQLEPLLRQAEQYARRKGVAQRPDGVWLETPGLFGKEQHGIHQGVFCVDWLLDHQADFKRLAKEGAQAE